MDIDNNAYKALLNFTTVNPVFNDSPAIANLISEFCSCPNNNRTCNVILNVYIELIARKHFQGTQIFFLCKQIFYDSFMTL